MRSLNTGNNQLCVALDRYLLDTIWFNKMKTHLEIGLESDVSSAGDRNAHPGPIDNSALFKADPNEPGEIREGMTDELDFTAVPEDAWIWLVRQFAIAHGQPAIKRRVRF